MTQWCWWDRRTVCSMSKAVITLNRQKTETILNRRKATTEKYVEVFPPGIWDLRSLAKPRVRDSIPPSGVVQSRVLSLVTKTWLPESHQPPTNNTWTRGRSQPRACFNAPRQQPCQPFSPSSVPFFVQPGAASSFDDARASHFLDHPSSVSFVQEMLLHEWCLCLDVHNSWKEARSCTSCWFGGVYWSLNICKWLIVSTRICLNISS
jgi:hypothetical protein